MNTKTALQKIEKPINETPSLNEFQIMKETAGMLVKTGFLPQAIKTPEQAVAIILTGRELGIGTMAALNTINVIQGKPTVSPQLMLALIERSGQLEDIRIDQSNDGGVVCTMKRKGRSPHSEPFGPKQATAMGLSGKDNYKKQAATMYRWRAVAACARVVFPDIILGLYTPDEMGADVNEDGEMLAAPKQNVRAIDNNAVIEGEVVEPETTETPDDHIATVCNKLNQLGDSIKWTKGSLANYVCDLFDDDSLRSADDLTDEQKTVLTEDLEERAKQIEAELDADSQEEHE